MKNLFYFVLGLCLIILTSATTVSVMTVKPAVPKSIIVFVGRGSDIANFIKVNTKKGYIVKHFSNLTATNGDTGDLVVMEKY